MEDIPIELRNAFNQRYKTALMVVLAFCLAVMVFMLVARFITPNDAVPGSEKWARPIYTTVIIVGVVVVVLRRILMSPRVIARSASKGFNAVFDKLLTVTIICLAAAEIVAIGGFAFYLMTGDYQYSWRLGVVSIFLIIYSIPRRREWESALIASVSEQSKVRD